MNVYAHLSQVNEKMETLYYYLEGAHENRLAFRIENESRFLIHILANRNGDRSRYALDLPLFLFRWRVGQASLRFARAKAQATNP